MVTRGRGDGSDDDDGLTPEVLQHRKLVRRSHFMTIVAAWVITVPASAVLSGVIFLILNAVAG